VWRGQSADARSSLCPVFSLRERKERLEEVGFPHHIADENVLNAEAKIEKWMTEKYLQQKDVRHAAVLSSVAEATSHHPLAIYLADLGLTPEAVTKVIKSVPSSFIENVGALSSIDGESEGGSAKVKADLAVLFGEKPHSFSPREVAVARVDHFHGFLQKLSHFGINSEDFGPIVSRCPLLIRPSPSITDVLPRRREFFLSLGIPESKFSIVFRRFPNLFFTDPSIQNERVQYFMTMGFSKSDIVKMTVRFPNILSYRVDEGLADKFNSLVAIGFSQQELIRVFVMMPQLFALRTTHVVIPRIQFLHETLDMPAENVKVALLRCPQLFYYRLDRTLLPKLDYLITFMQDNPSLFVQSRPLSLPPTHFNIDSHSIVDDEMNADTEVYDAFVERWKGTDPALKGEIVQVLTNYPQIVSLSLNRRIKPRLFALKYALEKKFPGIRGRAALPNSISASNLGGLMAFSDADFARTKLGVDEIVYDKFRDDLLHGRLGEDC